MRATYNGYAIPVGEDEDMRNEFEAILESTLEEVASELGADDVVAVEEETVNAFNKLVGVIAKHYTKGVATVLGSKYEDVPEAVLDSARNSFNKVLGKGKQKDMTSDIGAFGKVKGYIERNINSIKESKESEEKKETMLSKFGKFIKTLFVKAINVLIATGKIVGKVAIVITTLIGKVAVFTVDEVRKAGVSIFVIAKDEYKQAIRG